MSPTERVIAMGVVWVFWVMPFFINKAHGQGTAVKIDPRARFGIILTGCGFFFANFHRPVHLHTAWSSPVETWRAVAGGILGLAAIAISWMAVSRLGKQWRVDAGLNADHQLVQTGAYRLVRHPIYLSILLMLGMNLMFTGTLPGWPISIVLALAGTEVRVRVEDALLQTRFGGEFTAWQKRVPAYLPFIR